MLPPQKILFPTDFSTCADKAFSWALELAKAHDAELHVFHGLVLGSIFDDDAQQELQDLEDRLDGLASGRIGSLVATSASAVRVKRVTRRGLSAASLIRDYSDEEDIDLTVMGTHGRRTATHVLLGSVTEEVVRTSSNSVLTIRETETETSLRGIKKILVALDMSENSLQALPFAKELAASCGATLQLLHAVEPITYPSFYALKPGHMTSLLGDVEKRAKEELARAFLAADGPSVPFDAYVTKGDAVCAILDFAKTRRSDLIVLTTHGLTGLTRFLMGSVAEKVVRRADAAVLTVKV